MLHKTREDSVNGPNKSIVADFPVYRLSPGVVYSPRPGQHGKFINKNAWYVNEAGLNNAEQFSADPHSCALIGDSVVYGGNPVNYSDRVELSQVNYSVILFGSGLLVAGRWATNSPLWHITDPTLLR